MDRPSAILSDKQIASAKADGAAAFKAGRPRKAPDMVPFSGYSNYWHDGYSEARDESIDNARRSTEAADSD